jgi:hypothetical protein
MSLLSLLQDAAAELKQPSSFTSVVGNSNVSVKLLLALANAEIQECQRRFDWPFLIKQTSFTLVTSQTDYALPDDFASLVRETGFDASRVFPLYGPMTPQEASAATYLVDALPVNTYFYIEGLGLNQFHVLPVPGASDAGRVLHFRYKTTTCALPKTWTASTAFLAGDYCSYDANIYTSTAGGTTGSTAPTHTTGSASDGGITWTYSDDGYARFLKDTDTSVFGDYITKLGVMWRWMLRNGFDYSTEWKQWDIATKELYGNRKGERTIPLTGRNSYQFISGRNCPDTGIGT